MRQTFYNNEQRQIYRAIAPGAYVTLLAVARIFGREALHVISRVTKPEGSMYRGRPQPHWVHRLISSLRLFHVDHTGVPVNVVLCQHRHGRYGKGRAASAFGLTHFVDNDMDCLWSCCRDRHGNCRDTLAQNHGRLIWFDADSGVGQEELDRRLLQGLAARFGSVVNRNRTAMEKWVSVAASWTRVAELIDSRVADAVQVGWE